MADTLSEIKYTAQNVIYFMSIQAKKNSIFYFYFLLLFFFFYLFCSIFFTIHCIIFTCCFTRSPSMFSVVENSWSLRDKFTTPHFPSSLFLMYTYACRHFVFLALFFFFLSFIFRTKIDLRRFINLSRVRDDPWLSFYRDKFTISRALFPLTLTPPSLSLCSFLPLGIPFGIQQRMFERGRRKKKNYY